MIRLSAYKGRADQVVPQERRGEVRLVYGSGTTHQGGPLVFPVDEIEPMSVMSRRRWLVNMACSPERSLQEASSPE
jgi:hypothetical protein